MTTLSDTSPEAEQILIQLNRQMPPWRKLELMGQLNQMARVLALSDIRTKHPTASESQLKRLLADRLLGPELAAKAYGPLPDIPTNEQSAAAS